MFWYSISNYKSFEHIKGDYRKACRFQAGLCNVILVGNKCDLSDSYRVVSTKMGQDLANEWNVPFIETSAKTGYNISKIFELLIREYNKRKTNQDLQDDNAKGTSPGCVSCKLL